MRSIVIPVWCLAAVLVSGSAWSGIQSARPSLKIQQGHAYEVAGVDFAPGGRILASVSGAATIKLWDTTTGKQIRNFGKGNQSAAYSLAYSPDGRLIVVGGDSGELSVFDTASGLLVHELHTSPGFGSVWNVSFLPDSRSVLVTASSSLELWDIIEGKLLRVIKTGEESVKSCAVSPDGKIALSASGDRLMRLWSLETGALIRTFPKFSNDLAVVNFSPDGKYALSAEFGRHLVKQWSVSDAKLIRTFTGHRNVVTSVSMSPDGTRILSTARDGTVRLWNVASGAADQITPVDFDNHAIAGRFSPDGSQFAAGFVDCSLRVWKTKDKTQTQHFRKQSPGIESIALTPDGSHVLAAGKGSTLKLWDIQRAQLEKVYPAQMGEFTSCAILPDGKRFIAARVDGQISMMNLADGDAIRTYTGRSSEEYVFLQLSADGSRFVAAPRGSYGKQLELYETETGTLIRKIPTYQHYVGGAVLSPDGRQVYGRWKEKECFGADVDTGKIIWQSDDSKAMYWFLYHPSGVRLLKRDSAGKATLLELPGGRQLASFTMDAAPGGWVSRHTHALSADGTRVLMLNLDVLYLSMENGQLLRRLEGHEIAPRSVRITPDGAYGVTASQDGMLRVWNLSTGAWTSFMASADGSQWITFNSENYWDGSPDCGDFVAMVSGNQSWNIDQFAVRNNRPDLILDVLPKHDDEQQRHFHDQYLRRLRKMGFVNGRGEPDESLVLGELHVPQAVIAESKQSGKFMDIVCSLSDAKYALKRYNVYVNDVPIFGAYGREISGREQTVRERIELSSGRNKIEVSCMNEHGAESLRPLVTAEHRQPVKGRLYYIGFGVSRYRSADLNLKYAAKDAEDLGAVFSRMGRNYAEVRVHTFTDENCTVANIRAAKALLKDARPDDTVVLFIAGHGIHDTDRDDTYYFATHEADQANLAGSAADFDIIEDILQGIAPRNKFFLMDTCESGEIERDVERDYYAMAERRGIAPRAIVVKDKRAASARPRTYLALRNRYIYNDLVRRSGSIVFSSSRGGELSYESDDLRNGFFTNRLIAAMRGAGDADRNGMVSTDEIRSFVIAEVPKMAEGRQNPVVDRDNLYQKFTFPVTP